MSTTDLWLKSAVHAPVFWWNAIPSMAQARSAPRNKSAGARRIKGIHRTVSDWESKAAMVAVSLAAVQWMKLSLIDPLLNNFR